jgi:hypothetical protein
VHKRLFSVLMVSTLVAGVLVLAAPAAQAQRPFGVQQFHPNDTAFATGGNCATPNPGTPPGCIGDVLSDKFDGIDSLAHLTAVATPETTQVTWYACPLGTAVTTQGALSSCNITIGSDTTGVIPPIGPGASSPADEAYDVTWDIPGSLDQQRRDIAALACIGTGQIIEGGSANCRVDEEDNIFLEDAQTGAAANQTSSGELGQYRTLQGCFNVAPGNAACDAAYKAFPHGSPVPNDGFDFKAFTSDDVNFLQSAVNEPADAQQEPNNATFDGFVNCTLEQTFTNFKRWRCAIGDALIANDAELAVNILNANEGSGGPGPQPQGNGGFCNSNNNPNADVSGPAAPNPDPPSPQNQVPGAHGACVLDVHYVVSSARQASRFVQTFAPNAPSPSATASCANPDVDETSNLGTTEDITLCLFDQFSDPFAGPWTEETTGVGQFADCGGEGTGHDHNGDGRFEDCVGNTGPDGTSTGLTVQNPSGPTGDQTLTGCFDPQNQTTNPPVANHGCADAAATLKATKVVHWGTTATQVFLAFNNPAPSNAADPCRTGVTFKANTVGDHDDITVCTFDSSGNPVPTDTSPQRLLWQVVGAQGDEPTAVRFNPAPPPQETTGSGASAIAGLDAVEEGDNFVIAILLDSNGNEIDRFPIEKQVHAGPVDARDVPTVLTAKKNRKFIRGKAQTEDECQPGRNVTLFRRRKGPDTVIGVDTTNALGRWGVKTGRRRGTYYARIAASTATDVQSGGQLNCLPDQSNDVRRR